MVTMGRSERQQVDCITADHWQGAFDVTTHLIELGHERSGLLELRQRMLRRCGATRDTGRRSKRPV